MSTTTPTAGGHLATCPCGWIFWHIRPHATADAARTHAAAHEKKKAKR